MTTPTPVQLPAKAAVPKELQDQECAIDASVTLAMELHEEEARAVDDWDLAKQWQEEEDNRLAFELEQQFLDDEQPTSTEVLFWMHGLSPQPGDVMQRVLLEEHPRFTEPAVRLLHTAANHGGYGDLDKITNWVQKHWDISDGACDGTFTPNWCCTRCENKEDNYVCKSSWKQCAVCNKDSPLLKGEPYTPCEI